MTAITLMSMTTEKTITTIRVDPDSLRMSDAALARSRGAFSISPLLIIVPSFRYPSQQVRSTGVISRQTSLLNPPPLNMMAS